MNNSFDVLPFFQTIDRQQEHLIRQYCAISGLIPQYNGNIGAITWQLGTGVFQAYRYTYNHPGGTVNLVKGGS